MGKTVRLTNAAQEVVTRCGFKNINETVLWLDNRVGELSTQLNTEIRINHILNKKCGIDDE